MNLYKITENMSDHPRLRKWNYMGVMSIKNAKRIYLFSLYWFEQKNPEFSWINHIVWKKNAIQKAKDKTNASSSC